jgi:3-oxoacyl-[acyl-carrier-protein] synthase II
MADKVLITGLNIISSLGLNVEENWQNLLKGKSGVSKITLFDASNSQTKIAAQVPDTIHEYAEQFGKKRLYSQMTRMTKIGFVCVSEAIAKSGIDWESVDKSRCSCILGIVNSGNSSIEPRDPKHRIVKGMNNALPAWISIHYKLEGPSYSVSCACASSAYAVTSGYDMIKNGYSDIVIVGGTDSIINPEEIEGFNELFALSTNNSNPEKASCPFSKNRDGFVAGEGAGFLILESEKHALKRNASIYAEIAGYGLTSETYNIMAPMHDGEGMAKTMSLALQRSGVTPEQVDYINAHGTSTTLNDLYETLAIKKVFGTHAKNIAVSSSKSMIGHTIGAAGAVELCITAMSIKHNKITPTINYDEPDNELDLDYVPNKARDKVLNVAMSNSFAFGGHNASIILKKYHI